MPARNNPLIIASGYLLLEKDGRIPLLRRFNTGYMDGLYSLPAGHKEAGEFVTACAIREAQEETGVKLKENDVSIAHIMHRLCNDDERIDFFYRATNWSGTVSNIEPHRCDDISWFSLDKLPDNTVPYIISALGHIKSGTIYSEFNESDHKPID